jgi:hypothetical protein
MLEAKSKSMGALPVDTTLIGAERTRSPTGSRSPAQAMLTDTDQRNPMRTAPKLRVV